MSETDSRRPAGRAESNGGGEPRLLKWVAGATAVLSLVFALHQAIQLVSDGRERRRQIAELTSVAHLQQDSGDYRAAWASLDAAMEAAEPTGQLARLIGQLGSLRAQLRETQEDLAVAWLQNIQVTASNGETFTEIIGRLEPVLSRGASAADGTRKADLLSHVGWATFLKWREGRQQLNPDGPYVQAIEIDPGNPYANAYRAHWLLWTRDSDALTAAKDLFSAALASGRERGYVRRIQLAAMRNLGPDGDPEYIAVVNDMRAHDEAIDAETRRRLYDIYAFACSPRDDPDRFAQLSAVVPVGEQAATFEALLFGPDAPAIDASRRPGATACLAHLLEAAGEPEQALPLWLDLAEQFPPRDGNELGDRAREAAQRLQRRTAARTDRDSPR